MTRRGSGIDAAVPATAVIVRRDLVLGGCVAVEPLAALQLLRSDRHPVALIGDWAGGRAVLGSEPVTVHMPPADLGGVLGPLPACEPGAGAGPSFGGGWIGYLGYGVARQLHALPPAAGGLAQGRLPSWWFGYYDHVLVHDRSSGSWTFEALVTPAREGAIEARFAELSARFAAAGLSPEPRDGEGDRDGLGPEPGDRDRDGEDDGDRGDGQSARGPAHVHLRCGEFEVTPSPADHQDAVARAVELIRAGDVFQANITLRLEAGLDGDPLDLFCRGAGQLRPPYAAFLRIADDAAVASLSPELFLRRSGTSVLASPIKGTTERSADIRLAERQRATLTGSAKDKAENVMIVDLMRSDLASVCRPGTVVVPRLTAAQAHPGVWHLVSDVRGELPSGRADAELLTATFPPGSVTGAPKVRAMEVIAELEATPREVYTGAIGYRSPVAGLELNVAIRTFECAAGRVWLGAGGGIVADSDPAAEYAECLVKARPLIAAVGGRFGTADGPLPSPVAGSHALAPRPATGIFTSLPVTGGLPDGLPEHLARLAASARDVFGKDLPPELPAVVGKCLAGGGSGRLRITVRPLGGPLHCEVELADAGPGPGPGLGGVRLRVTKLAGGLGAHKWADRRLLRQYTAGLAPGEQVLLTDADGSVLETDSANVFVVAGGVLRTPAADGRILPGIMRERVLAAARSMGVTVVEGPLPFADLAAADEVFVTNAIRGVLPVVAAEGRLDGWQPGAITARLAAAVRDPGFNSHDHRERGRPPSPQPAEFAVASPRRSPRRTTAPVLVIDNYDSFTYNLVDLLRAGGAAVEVVRNDEATAAQVAGYGAAGVVISPGPCAPAEAGICVDVVRALGGRTPMLGVCLGHEAIVVAYGGSIERVDPVHGKASVIEHDGHGIFAGLPPAFPAARYHSLLLAEASLPAVLAVSARSAGLPMAVRHRTFPVDGVQFHPESILTRAGPLLIGNFLRRVRRS